MPAPITNNWGEDTSVGNTFTEDFTREAASCVVDMAVVDEAIVDNPYQDWV